MKKKISIVSGCFNEEKNLREFYQRIVKAFDDLDQYDFEIILEDNCSSDDSRNVLRSLAANDKRVKVILNSNNFGPVRSGFNAFLNASGDAAISIFSDLQDPPELIPDLIHKWESGYSIVCGVKKQSNETSIMFAVRKLYYWLLASTSETELISNFTGFGLYDKCFIDAVRKYNDPYPYFRGLVSEIGFKRCELPYTQEKRRHGKSSYNLFRYYDFAMTGFVNYSKLPLRLAVFAGFILGATSFLIAMTYFIFKLIYWDSFSFGMAPIMIGIFFFASIHLFFIGLLGEYIMAIWTQVKRKPLVIEEERINFEDEKK